ncbi:MAG TPA: cation diffusion facilitator family transporter [Fervidobacterium sp.]|nr:cation diffusion facilitator family transporter [Fervidobacterium sp.]HPT54501.1 cation diffusion facilitator family transporter [Fervidobacterium sp.]HPZ17907.1 cation diffusion facilitator family transporter [Fervidobacterium sp.]HQE48765.1 cation diffusion facilitator family transporter [Fervidobacterium sp.]HUM42798.1 cation diffusion facilitator family transporter [Fervidobacterium sp.]
MHDRNRNREENVSVHQHHDHHGHSHDHSPLIDSEISGVRLFYVVLLNFGITAAELIGGIIAGSLSLISDSLHNFSDAMSIVVTYFAHRISLRRPSEKKTFGYKRSTILAAFLNSLTLLVIGGFLIKEAVERFANPVIVESTTVIWVGSIGLIANLLSMYLLRKWSGKDMNIRSAYLHMLTDALSSVVVILGAIVMRFSNLNWLDPLLTIFIAAYVIEEGFQILSKSINILMQSVPEVTDINTIVEELKKIEEIQDIHHVHVWSLDEKTVFFEGHINLKQDLPISKAMAVEENVKSLLENFGISHVTIQFEYNGCPDCGVIKE